MTAIDPTSPAPGGTRAMVAPELLPVLDLVPTRDLTPDLLSAIRSGIGMTFPPPQPLAPELQAVACEERFAPGPAGAPNVRMLVYRPAGAESVRRPAFLHIHGGGYVLGSPEFNDASNRGLVAELGCVVASVDYRLAPETPFPGSLEDCYAALRWLHANADALGIDPDLIAIGGESAGGGHAAALAILARDRGELPICLQLLDSPMLDDRTGTTADPHPYCGEFIWTPANNRFGWRALLGMEPGGPATPAGAAPARIADLSSLPPAFILVGALDLFLEEDMEYARRLSRAGVAVELHVIPGAYHGFRLAGDAVPQVQESRRWQVAALRRAFRGRGAA